jgi:hypothetical protein
MSNVTNIVLATTHVFPEDEFQPFLERVNAYFAGTARPGGFVAVEDPTRATEIWASGTGWALECSFALGAFNHLDLDELVAHIRAIEVDDETVQLLVHRQEDLNFHVVDVHRRASPREDERYKALNMEPFNDADRWTLAHLSRTVVATTGELAAYRGTEYTMLGRTPDDEYERVEPEAGSLWRIRLHDGEVVNAYGDEIAKEVKENGGE